MLAALVVRAVGLVDWGATMVTPRTAATVETVAWALPASQVAQVITAATFKILIGYHPCQRRAVMVGEVAAAAAVALVAVKTAWLWVFVFIAAPDAVAVVAVVAVLAVLAVGRAPRVVPPLGS